MKFHRVEGKLPAGVTVQGFGTTPAKRGSVFDHLDAAMGAMSFSAHVTTKYTSTDPIKISLEVPEDAAADTARILREMADELTGTKR